MLTLGALGAQTPGASGAPPSSSGEAGREAGGSEGDGTDENSEDGDAEDDEESSGERFRPWFSLGADLLFFVEDSSLESDPEPILPALFLGFGFPVVQAKSAALFIVPSLDVYWTHYRWSEARNRPVPAAIENRDEFVVGFFTGIGAEGRLRVKKSFSLRLGLGLSADLRLVLLAEGLNDTDPIDTINKEKEKVNDYFWQGGNFLFANISLGFDFKVLENYNAGINVKAWVPFAAPERYGNDSALLGWRFGVMISFSRLIGPTAASEAEAAAPPPDPKS